MWHEVMTLGKSWHCYPNVHTPCFADQEKKKKILVHKNQGWEPSIKSTRQMRTQEDTTQRQNKSKWSTTPCFGDQEKKKKNLVNKNQG